MFLKLLSEEYQDFFLELASLLITAEPREEDSRELLEDVDFDKKPDDFSEIFMNMGNGYDVYGDKKTDNWFVPTGEEVDALVTCFVEMRRTLDKNAFLHYFFKRDFMKSLKPIVKNATENEEYKKQVLTSFIESGVDLSEITPKKTEYEVAKLVGVRKEMIDSILKQCFENIDLVNLTHRDKKIIMFELIGLAHADGSVHELEEMIVNSVASNFAMDNETLDELKEAAEVIVDAVKEATEIITE